MSDNLDPIDNNDPSKIEVMEAVIEKGEERPDRNDSSDEKVPHGTNESTENHEEETQGDSFKEEEGTEKEGLRSFL
mgnify:CR=1 FL=1